MTAMMVVMMTSLPAADCSTFLPLRCQLSILSLWGR